MRRLILKSAFSVALLLFLAAPVVAEPPATGTVTGEMRFGDEVIKLTHVYVMEPFVLPDAPPDPEVERRLIVILGDRPYSGDLPPAYSSMLFYRSGDDFNGLRLELDRTSGAIRYVGSLLSEAVFERIHSLGHGDFTTEEFGATGKLVTAKIVTMRPARQTKPEVPEIAVVRGSLRATQESQTTSAESDFRLTVAFSAPLQFAPPLIKTLVGHDARSSDIARAFGNELRFEAEVRSADHMQLLLDSGFDESSIAAARERLKRHIPDARAIAARLSSLERIHVYADRAVLQFRPATFRQRHYSVVAANGEISNVIALRSGDSLFQHSMVSVKGGDMFAPIVILRSASHTKEIKPFALQGDSILPVEGTDAAADIHMILDDGTWRLARN